MAGRGPAPKRSSQRRRRNVPAAGPAEHVIDPNEVLIPPADDAWHRVAKHWYESLARSGQSQFYASSDWATAYVLAESMSREFNPQPVVVGRGAGATVEMVEMPPKGASLAAWLRGMTALLVTEGDRRRARIELEKPRPTPPPSQGVTWLDSARRHR